MNRVVKGLIVQIAAVGVIAALIGLTVRFVLSSRNDNTISDAPPASVETNSDDRRISRELALEVGRIDAREQSIADTVWSIEMLAQECGRSFEEFWNAINAATNKLACATNISFTALVLGNWIASQPLAHGIELRHSIGPGASLARTEWKRLIAELDAGGWRLDNVEFRHIRFDVDLSGQPLRSEFDFSVRLSNPKILTRAILDGPLVVDWGHKDSDLAAVPIKRIDASGLQIRTRQGEPPFRPALEDVVEPPENSFSIDPLIVYDLDADGFSEIILAAKNTVYRRGSDGRYRPEPLLPNPGLISTAVVGDFDGDGYADFLAHKLEGLILARGSRSGVFTEPAQLVWTPKERLAYPFALTCGDIDRDGDLDLFLAQYKVPYENGAMPTPYYDANDGNPAYLLLNNGSGKFFEATQAAGLERKRWRRTYSCSFADLNRDGLLDLVVVSDFAGIDIYRNIGGGRFHDVTKVWTGEPQAFGMAHAFADFNRDGLLDVLMIGMTSPTAERLEHLNLWRPDADEDRSMRARMTIGNRLFVARAADGFEQNILSKSIARSGWSWGTSAFDSDNDGFVDVYIANGLESRESVRDYESEYWLHDKYVGVSKEDSAAYLYFRSKFSRTRGRGQSYGGYEKNRLFLNERGARFVEVGHLFGVALEQDSRNVVTDDLNADGRVDLIVTSFETWPEAKQTLRVYENRLSSSGNWIGFRFQNNSRGRFVIGAEVELVYSGCRTVRQIVTGDSYRSQHAPTVHFGIGGADHIDSATVRWSNGETWTMKRPQINRYHTIDDAVAKGNPN